MHLIAVVMGFKYGTLRIEMKQNEILCCVVSEIFRFIKYQFPGQFVLWEIFRFAKYYKL